MEAGHRCAIPTCRNTTVEIAHIIPWEKVRRHAFENLIALCPTCHTLYDVEKKIDPVAMKGYKANLGLLSSRYNDDERRLLEYFAEYGEERTLDVAAGFEFHFMYLLRDGLIRKISAGPVTPTAQGLPLIERYELTQTGRGVVESWAAAAPLEPEFGEIGRDSQ